MIMRDTGTALREQEALAHVGGICLKTGPPRRIGVEVEWLVRDARDPALPVPPQRTAAAVSKYAADGAPRSPGAPGPAGLPCAASPGVLPSGALLTCEPGGQLEVSSLPAVSLADCIEATAADLASLRGAAASQGLELAGYGLDPVRAPRRVLDQPRYAAMEAYFDRGGPWGRQMMCSTASVQVCVDAGDETDTWSGCRSRWQLLHALGPVLVAAFANSPLRRGHPTRWVSSRQQVWRNLDPGRTRPPRADGCDPRAAWAQYALDAELMMVADPSSADWTAPPGVTLRDWVRGCAGPLREPAEGDVAQHLTTLFPPVRPRGHYEVRVIDAQPGEDGWIVPVAVVAALAGDERAADAAMAAVQPLWDRPGGEDPWLTAARCGPQDAAIARASRDCFAAARAALERQRSPQAARVAVDAFIETYVDRSRCPADDVLEESR